MRANALLGGVSALLAWTVAAGSAYAVNGSPTWSIVSLWPGPGGTQYVSSPRMAFDHYGTPAVSWSIVDAVGIAANQVYHSQQTPLGLWSHRQMASGIGSGLLTSVSYDRAERPHVAWLNSNGSLNASFNFGASQNLTAAPAAATALPSLSLRHDLAGNLVGIYAGSSAGQIGAITWNGTTYSRALLTTLPGVSSVRSAALTIDHRGLRHMVLDAVLQPSGARAVVLASEPANNAAWVSGVLTTADAVTGVDITTRGSDGRVAFTYATRTGTLSQLFYAESNGSTITTATVSSSSTAQYGGVSLAFDRTDGQPAIGFVDATNRDLLFSFRNPGGTWTTGVVDPDISLTSPLLGEPIFPSLAFNEFGTGWPALAYVGGNGDLRVAFDPPAPEPATAVLFPAAAVAFARRRIGRGGQS